MRRAAVLLLLSSLAASCGGGNRNPVAPGPTVNSVTITVPADIVLVGRNSSLNGSATMSDGTTVQITSTGQWSSSDSTIATIDATGVLRGVGAGLVTVTLNHQGRTATASIRIVPDYGGVWLGSYSVMSCQDDGRLAGICGPTFPLGRVLPVAFLLTQTGAQLIGNTAIGSVISEEFTISIELNGSTVILTRAHQDLLTTDQTWRINITTAGRITGTGTLRANATAGPGTLTLEVDLNDVILQSAAQPLQATAPRTLGQAIDAIVGR